MFRVAGVGSVLCDYFSKEEHIDRKLILNTLLLHDMGNILKIDFDSTEFLADEDKNRIKTLRNVQNEFKERYGHDADAATIAILKELGVGQDVVDLCAGFHGKLASEFLHESIWEKKICYYSDMRVSPKGVVGVVDRFEDLKDRYSHDKDNIQIYQNECLEIEEQIQKAVQISVHDITEIVVKVLQKELASIDIATKAH